MYPHSLEIFGARLSIWNAMFLVAVVAGYFVLRYSIKIGLDGPAPRLLLLRWLITVYVAVLGAQLFAYVFDLKTTLLPPRPIHWANYYFNPLFGPKTLYGAIVVLPLAVLIASVPWQRLSFTKALACWTPALMAVLVVARLGCFMQGCCYGVPSDTFGMSLSQGSVLYFQELHEGLILAGSPTLRVIPTQAISSAALAGLLVWSLRWLRQGSNRVFADTIAAYSVFRFAIEFVRDDAARNFYGPLSTSQWIAVSCLVLYGTWRLARRTRLAP